MVVEHNWRSTWTRPLRDAPLGDRCGETMELEGSEPTINTPPHSRDIQMEIMRKSSSGWKSIGIGWEDMILPGVEGPRNCVDPWNLGQSDWDQKLGKIECVFSLYDMMRWKWDDVCLLQGLPNIYSPSLCPPPLPLYHRIPTVAPWRCTYSPGSSDFGDALADQHRVNSEMHLEAGIEGVWRCTWRPRNRVNSEMHLEAEIKWTQRCTGRLWSSKFGDALGDQHRVNSEIHLETEIKWTQRCTRRPWSSEFGDALRDRDCELRDELGDRDGVNSEDALGGRDRMNWDMHSEAVIERVWRCTEAEIEWAQRFTWRPWSIKMGQVLGGSQSGGDWSEGGQSGGSESGGGRSGGMCNGRWDSIHWLTSNSGNVENWVQHGPLKAERLAGGGRQSILGWCSIWCMQYSVYTLLGVCSTRCMLYLVYAVLGVCCTRFMLYSVLTLDHGMERYRGMT